MTNEQLEAESTVIVVGASLAGWRAVETLRTEGYEGTITLVGGSAICPTTGRPFPSRSWPGRGRRRRRCWPTSDARASCACTRCSATAPPRSMSAARRVTLDDGNELQGDGLVITTGATPRPLPGTEDLSQADGLFTLRTLDDCAGPASRGHGHRGSAGDRHRRRLHRGRGGLDLLHPGLQGHRARGTGHPAPAPPRSRDRRALRLAARGARGRAAHRRRRRCACAGRRRRTAGPAGAHRLEVELDGGEVLAADVVVVGIGVVPETEWLRDSGLTLENGVACDDRLFAADGVVAAGDVARWNWRHDGAEEMIRIEHWNLAAEAGVAAARNLLAGRSDATSFTPVPYFWSDQYGIRFQVIGSPRGSDEVKVVDGSFEEGKFVALFGRDDRLSAVMAIGRPRQLMLYRPLLEHGSSWAGGLGPPDPDHRVLGAVVQVLRMSGPVSASRVAATWPSRRSSGWAVGSTGRCPCTYSPDVLRPSSHKPPVTPVHAPPKKGGALSAASFTRLTEKCDLLHLGYNYTGSGEHPLGGPRLATKEGHSRHACELAEPGVQAR